MVVYEKYKNSLVEDFLTDEYFIHSMLLGDESMTFWDEVGTIYPHQKEIIKEARQTFRRNVKLNSYAPSEKEIEEETEKLVAAIARISKQMQRKRYLKLIVSVAASVAVISISIFHFNSKPINNLTTNSFDIDRAKIVIDNNITLITSDTTIVVADQSEVDQHSLRTEKEKLEESTPYSQLVVPYGRRSSLLLADGSKVWINSGTIVQFPANFDGDIRHIKVDGEIYIDVVKDAKRKFIVSTPSFDVEVQGTSFNVSAYTDDVANHVVLVEGKVAVKRNGNVTTIKPQEQYLLTHNIETINQVDINDFVSWRYGWLQAEGHTLENLSKQLSRYYNINIVCDPNIAQRIAGGKLRLFDNVEEALKILSTNMNIKYTLDDNKIRISNAE